MSIEESNTALVYYYIDESWNKGNIAVTEEVLSPDFVQHARGVPPGRDGVKGFFAMLRAGFSNISNTIEDTVAEGDLIMWRSTVRATHTGVFRGIPPTGKDVKLTTMNIMRIENGKFVENWGEQDNLGLMQQLGVIPTPR